ncbi:MAG: hypothetical protein MJZ08_02570 [Bacteroidaceae bacterium]|nr:hypothetical protein [Bacteroidaceae bacterium]
MANSQGSVVITPESLAQSFKKFRQELLTMPLFALAELLQYVTVRTGLRNSETVGQLSGDMQMAPYKPQRHDTNDVSIVGRTLQVYFGNVVKSFDPNSVVDSIYGSSITKGEGLKNVPITKQVCAYLMKKMGEHLFEEMFTAERDATGDTTHDLFDGWKTIAQKEINKGDISLAKKNLQVFSAITVENAEDKFKEFFWGANAKLRGQNTNLLCSPLLYHYYTEAYQYNHGALPYNQGYEKAFIEGSQNKCRIAPVANVPDDFLCLSPKSTLLIGCNLKGEEEKLDVVKSLSSHFWLDFVATMFWGCEFETISPEMLQIGMVIADSMSVGESTKSVAIGANADITISNAVGVVTATVTGDAAEDITATVASDMKKVNIAVAATGTATETAVVKLTDGAGRTASVTVTVAAAS